MVGNSSNILNLNSRHQVLMHMDSMQEENNEQVVGIEGTYTHAMDHKQPSGPRNTHKPRDKNHNKFKKDNVSRQNENKYAAKQIAQVIPKLSP